MSLENDFDKLIERQNPQRKAEVWKKLQARIAEEAPETEVELGEVLAKKKFSKNRIILISAGFLLIVALVAIILFTVLPKSQDITIKRYNQLEDYNSVQVQQSIEDYAKENNYDLLYFDWYKSSEEVTDLNYKLNESEKIICVCEQIMDVFGNYISMWITDIYTELDIFDEFNDVCNQNLIVNSTEIEWGTGITNCYATFRYKGWDYHIKLEYNLDTEYFISLLEDLIK